MDALVARLLALRTELGRGVAVGISGIDCAGKSTLAETLRSRLARHGVPTLVVSGDEFTRPTTERYAAGDDGRAYYRDSFDYRFLFDELLPALRRGESGAMYGSVSDWEGDAWRPASFMIEPGAIVLVEGCFLFTAARGPAFDLRIWIDVPFDLALERAARRPRDLERMGGAAGVRARYERRYIPGQRLHLERDAPRSRADIVLTAHDMMSP